MSKNQHKRLASRVCVTMQLLLAACVTGCASSQTHPGTATAARTMTGAEAQLASVQPALENVEFNESPWQYRVGPAIYNGVHLATPNYDIYTTIRNDRTLSRLPLFMERALLHYRSSLADLPEPPSRFETYVFGDRRQWEMKTNEVLPGEAGMFNSLGRGGFSTRGIAVLYDIDYRGWSRDTLAISAHEGWHQYTQKTFRNQLPVWLEEGVATYMEGFTMDFRADSGGPTFSPKDNTERERELSDSLRRGRLIPLEELLNRSPQGFLEDGKNRLLVYYAQVWALTRFLAEGEDGKYSDKLTAVLTDAAEGRLVRVLMSYHTRNGASRGGRGMNARVGPVVLQAYFNEDLKAFEAEYMAFVEQLAEAARTRWDRRRSGN